MDIQRLHAILSECTFQLRKGEQVERSEGIEVIDMEFLAIGVTKSTAEAHKNELVGILRSYPNPDRLAAGPSYIELGAEIGDQGAAFQLFALGKTLGLWDVITPARLGITGPQAAELAGMGMIMCTGFKEVA